MGKGKERNYSSSVEVLSKIRGYCTENVQFDSKLISILKYIRLIEKLRAVHLSSSTPRVATLSRNRSRPTLKTDRRFLSVQERHA